MYEHRAIPSWLKPVAAGAADYVKAVWLSALIGALWTFSLCLLFLNAFIQEPDYFFITGVVMMSIAGMLHLMRFPAIRNGSGWFFVAGGVVCGAVAIAAPLAVDSLRRFAHDSSIKAFKAQREEYKSASSGFPFLIKLAEQYHVHLDLADADSAWAATTMKSPYESPASVETYSGYCSVNMNTMVLNRTFGPGRKLNGRAWVEGVQVHELGHCLDIRRDVPAGAAITSSLHSVPPDRASKVVTVADYLEVNRADETKLWHEAVADVFAVGYWRLKYPNDSAALAAHLRTLRVDGALEDPIHATACWIDKAAATPLDPRSPIADLFTWADAVRLDAHCSLAVKVLRGFTR